MRYWLLTNTAYGTWLPGDARGSVTSVRGRREGDPPGESRTEHDLPGEPWEDAIPGLQRHALEAMKGEPIFLDLEKAEMLLAQFQETAAYRGWTLFAVAIMANHFHIVVGVPGDPAPRKVLVDFKAYASRVLNRRYGEPASETWWTKKGSKRKLRDDKALSDGVAYVLYKQPYAPFQINSLSAALPRCARAPLPQRKLFPIEW
jgi:REP element-mobilizing transposase RayT